jgi:hypothetical protein
MVQELAHRPSNMQPPDLTKEGMPATVANPVTPARAVDGANQPSGTLGHLCGDKDKGASTEVTRLSTLLFKSRWTPPGLTGGAVRIRATTACKTGRTPWVPTNQALCDVSWRVRLQARPGLTVSGSLDICSPRIRVGSMSLVREALAKGR